MRTSADGAITVLAERYQGRRYNQPNDLTVDSLGRIYFSDPQYGSREDLKTLYITAGGAIYSIRTSAPGRIVWPQTK